MSASGEPPLTYAAAGVDVERARRGLHGLLGWVRRSGELRQGRGAGLLPIGYFANVVDLGGGQGLAISTDGVGTKLLIAQRLDRYDTIGVDCVAMNVNDVLCVGAEPLAHHRRGGDLEAEAHHEREREDADADAVRRVGRGAVERHDPEEGEEAALPDDLLHGGLRFFKKPTWRR